MSHAFSITVVPLSLLATFHLVLALHRYSFTVVLAVGITLDDGSSPSTPRLKTAWSFRDYIHKPEKSPGENYIDCFEDLELIFM